MSVNFGGFQEGQRRLINIPDNSPERCRPRTWSEWLKEQADRTARIEQFGEFALIFGRKELAHLAFVRWEHLTGRIES